MVGLFPINSEPGESIYHYLHLAPLHIMMGQAPPPTWWTCKISKKCKRGAGRSGSDKGVS